MTCKLIADALAATATVPPALLYNSAIQDNRIPGEGDATHKQLLPDALPTTARRKL